MLEKIKKIFFKLQNQKEGVRNFWLWFFVVFFMSLIVIPWFLNIDLRVDKSSKTEIQKESFWKSKVVEPFNVGWQEFKGEFIKIVDNINENLSYILAKIFSYIAKSIHLIIVFSSKVLEPLKIQWKDYFDILLN